MLLSTDDLEAYILLTMPLRKQGGAAVVTIPPSVLERLDLKIGAKLEMDVRDGALVMVPSIPLRRKRYTLAQLLEGATPATVRALNRETAGAREGDSMGRELA